MIYVDSNVPMYLVGGAHPNKPRVIELVSRLLSAREHLVTSAETFQEILHRFLALRNREHGAVAWDTGRDGEPAGWPRRGVTTSRKVGAPEDKGAGVSQDGVTCRFRATESRPPMARETGHRQG